MLGRNSAPHNAVRDVLSHLVVQNGVTDAAVVETRLAAADGSIYDADVVLLRSILLGEGHLGSFNRHNRVWHLTR